MPGKSSPWALGRERLRSRPSSWPGLSAGIASGGVFKRPHVVEPDQLPAEYRQAMYDSYPGSGDVTVPIDTAIWQTITDGMAGALDPT